MKNNILLLDGNSLVYRAYYGTAFHGNDVLRNRNGLAVNAILTFNKMLNKFLKNYNPSHILIAFDTKEKTNRHKKLDSYKANRSETPSDLLNQFPIIKEMLDLLGFVHYEKAGFEADDILGSATQKYQGDFKVITSDKDMYQLVSEQVSLVIPQNGAKPDIELTNNDFYDKLGYHPSQVADIKGLAGDSSDNLPGVVGIGPKGAVKLIEEYKSLENIYENVDKLSDKLKEKLLNNKESAFLCKELANLILDVPIPYDLSAISFNGKISKKLFDFFENYGLPSLTKFYKSLDPNLKAENEQNFSKIIL